VSHRHALLLYYVLGLLVREVADEMSTRSGGRFALWPWRSAKRRPPRTPPSRRSTRSKSLDCRGYARPCAGQSAQQSVGPGDRRDREARFILSNLVAAESEPTQGNESLACLSDYDSGS
jgi:hypothetical protein